MTRVDALRPGGLLAPLNKTLDRWRTAAREAYNRETIRGKHAVRRLDATLLGRPDPGPLPRVRRV